MKISHELLVVTDWILLVKFHFIETSFNKSKKKSTVWGVGNHWNSWTTLYNWDGERISGVYWTNINFNSSMDSVISIDTCISFWRTCFEGRTFFKIICKVLVCPFKGLCMEIRTFSRCYARELIWRIEYIFDDRVFFWKVIFLVFQSLNLLTCVKVIVRCIQAFNCSVWEK